MSNAWLLLDSDLYGMRGWQESGILGLGTGEGGWWGGGEMWGGVLGCRGVFSGGEDAGFRRFGWLVSE